MTFSVIGCVNHLQLIFNFFSLYFDQKDALQLLIVDFGSYLCLSKRSRWMLAYWLETQ